MRAILGLWQHIFLKRNLLSGMNVQDTQPKRAQWALANIHKRDRITSYVFCNRRYRANSRACEDTESTDRLCARSGVNLCVFLLKIVTLMVCFSSAGSRAVKQVTNRGSHREIRRTAMSSLWWTVDIQLRALLKFANCARQSHQPTSKFLQSS